MLAKSMYSFVTLAICDTQLALIFVLQILNGSIFYLAVQLHLQSIFMVRRSTTILDFGFLCDCLSLFARLRW
jgi:hypothetical protein